MDDLIGMRLVAVERLAWTEPNGSTDLRVGPAHLHFDGGHGAVLDGEADWQLAMIETIRDDESWLVPYRYDIEGAHWTIRDASDEPPFSSVLGARLESWESIHNEVGERVGLVLHFDSDTITLEVHRGELTT
ncbi:hypothetical protein [Actinopolymorpha pittospori]